MGGSCTKQGTLEALVVGGIQAEKPSGLSERQKTVLRSTWQVVKLDISNVGVMTFVSMFESQPDLIKIFSSFRGKGLTELQHSGLIHAHALRVMATVDKCVSRLDDLPEIAAILAEVGTNHRRNGVPFDQIKSILPHFLAAIRPHIDTVWNDEVAEAWRCLFVLLIYHMTDALDLDKKH